MTYNWEWSAKMNSEVCSQIDKSNYRYLLVCDATGNYSVIKFMVRNSLNLSFQAARPLLITKGWNESRELAKQKAVSAFEKFVYGAALTYPEAPVRTAETAPETEESAPAEEPQTEETVEEPAEETVAESAPEETPALAILAEQGNGSEVIVEIKATMPLDEKAKIKYTLTGKDVQVNSKVYTEPLAVPAGTTVKAAVYCDGALQFPVEAIV